MHALGAPDYRRAAPPVRLPARRDGRAVPRVPRRDRADVGGRRRPALPRRGSASALAEAQRYDVARVFRAPEWDPSFPGDQMLPALEATLADLGVDLYGQENVELDVEQREKKTPRAFCSPIEVPQRVVLVIQPIGGVDDWRALFHEAGHTEHFAHTRADLSVEERRLGDFAVTEGWAMLMEHLVQDAAWLNRRLDVPRPSRVRRRERDRAPLPRPPLLRQGALRARAARGRRPAAAAEALRRDPRRRAEDRAEPDRLPRRRRRRLLLAPSTCAPGPSRRS